MDELRSGVELMSDLDGISQIEDVIEDARNGRMIILVDADDRENEGDLIIPAQMATPDAVNFMAKHGRGLICLALTGERAATLNLEYMADRNQSRHQTAFTVSIEAREGISTGISAHDRAHTISVAIDPTKDARDLVSPGHVFPLVARDGGVLVRAGHTEAAVDIARLAGLYPAGVICEIMNDDGTMARLPDLIKFAQFHGIKIGTIADLIAYRRKYDNLVRREMTTGIDSDFGGAFELRVYVQTEPYTEHIALVKGDLEKGEPVLVRMQAVNLVDDLIGAHVRRGSMVQHAMREIGREGRGVIVILRDIRPKAVTERLKARSGPDVAASRAEAQDPPDNRLVEYGIGAQILADLGVHDMVLLSNGPQRRIPGLEGYGLKIVGQRPIPLDDDQPETGS